MSLENDTVFPSDYLYIYILMKNNLFNTQFGAVYQQMVKLFLVSFMWKWTSADTQHILFESSFSIYHLSSSPKTPHSIFQAHEVMGSPESAFLAPHHANTHVCAEPRLSVCRMYEAIDTDTACGNKIWQSWALLPPEHDFRRQGEGSYS